MKILDRYIAKEFIPPFLLGVVLFTFVLLSNRIFRLTELIINRGVSVLDILRLISYILPSFLTLTIPMSVLLGGLVAFGRLSTDCEVTALKAGGVPFLRMVAPVLAMSVAATVATSYFSLYLAPLKARDFKKDLMVIARNRAFVNVEEEVFSDAFKNVIIYAQKTPAPNEMEGVFISDERKPSDPHVIIARKGSLDVDLATGYAYLRLQQGSIQKRGERPGSYQEIGFDENTVSINLYDKLLSDDDARRGKREMTLSELREVASGAGAAGDRYSLLTEYYKRFTIPLACIVFGVAGPPLGLFSRRSGKSSGITVALVVFAFYYFVMKVGENLASGGSAPPLLAALMPNIAVGALGVYLAFGAEKEKRFRLGVPRFLRRGKGRRRDREDGGGG